MSAIAEYTQDAGRGSTTALRVSWTLFRPALLPLAGCICLALLGVMVFNPPEFSKPPPDPVKIEDYSTVV